MKKISIKERFGRGALFSALTLFIIVALLVGNVALAYLGQRRMLFADLTPEGLYTLSDEMVKECSFVDELTEKDTAGKTKKIEILFCTDPDILLSSALTRIPYMATALDNKFENVTVNTVNSVLNPSAVSEYKTTSLTKIKPSNVIISYGSTYRIIDVKSLWGVNDSDQYVSYNGEYKMASIIKSLTAVEKPEVCFVTNHGEEYYDVENPSSDMSQKLAAFYELLINRGFKVSTIDLENEEIPEDCVLLVINNPKEDLKSGSLDNLYDYSEADKIDRYLVRDYGSVLATKDYEISLPIFEQLMFEWGIEFCEGIVKDDPSKGGALSGEHVSGGLGTDIVGKYITNDKSHAYEIYKDYATLPSAPRFIIPNTGYIKCSFKENSFKQEDGAFYADRNYSTFFTTSANAKAYDENGYLVSDSGMKDLMAVATRTELDGYTAEYSYSYIAAAHSPDFLSSDVLANASYANYDILTAIINNISRADRYASISLGGLSLNSSSYGGKMLVNEGLSENDVDVFSNDASEVIKVNYGISASEIVIYGVISFIAPIAALAVGIAVRIKRKFL